MANAGKPKPFTVYLAGPMSGHEDYNFPAFHRAARRLREFHIVVINPAETAGGVKHMPREVYFQYDFAVIGAACDAIVVLPGWRNSTGAKAEVIFGKEIGIPIYQYDPEKGLGNRIDVSDWSVDYTIKRNGGTWRGQVVETEEIAHSFPVEGDDG